MPKIAVVSSSRADYWLLRPLLQKLQQASCLQLLISGENLQAPMLNKIRTDGFEADQLIECILQQDSYLDLAQTISRGIGNFAEVLNTSKPDLVVVLGDRYEIFSAAVAAYSLKIPLAHIHGGEVTQGALDDGYRHAISKLARLHFVSHEQYRSRLLKMGEQPQSVYLVGALGLDQLSASSMQTKIAISYKYPFLANKEYFLLTLHSSTATDEITADSANTIIEAMAAFQDYHIVVTKANSDPGGAIINERWCAWQKSQQNVSLVETLGDDYLSVAAHAKLVIGNSSSGILEIPYLDRPALNLGFRQEGRVLPHGVYNCSFDSAVIKQTIEDIFANYRGSSKVYGEPGTIAEKISRILTSIDVKSLTYKRFFDETK